MSRLDIWDGSLRRCWPELGIQAVVLEMTFGKGRICVGAIDDWGYSQGY